MKASLSVALALAGACLAGRVAAQSVVVGPRAGSMALVRGTQVTVPIVADLSGSGGASLGSVTAQLHWRPSVLAYRGASAGALGSPVVNADSAAGSLRFALANPAGATGQPILVNAIFSVIGAAGATDTLRVSLQELTRAGTFADLLPIGAATTSLLCVSTGLFGDLDGSGAVTSADALAIVTSAVGLPIAPYTTVNGDVDSDGRVDTRDALVVLSYVVGLPVAGFRVARVNGGACAVPAPASVQIAPRTASVTTGDRFPLAATVRDSSGAVVSGIGLVWTSADTAVVKADATGNLVGVGPGTTQVYANAAPGLKDSVTVSVTLRRSVWYVNPAAAARNAGVELGSPTYPFSTIAQAVNRAVAFDSVFVAPAVYGEGVRLTKSIFVIGDSTAAGRTIIRNATGPAIAVDGLASGGVRLDRLWIEDSQGGIVARGTPGGSAMVWLDRVSVARSRGVGISVHGVGAAWFDDVIVAGAVARGIDVDSVAVVQFHAVQVDGVGPDGLGGQAAQAVHVGRSDSVSADSMLLATAGFRLESARVALFHHFAVRGAAGAALWATVGQTFTLDSADIGGVGPVGSMPGDTMPAALGVQLGGGSATARISHVTIHQNDRAAFALAGADSVLLSRVSVLDSPRGPAPGAWTVAFAETRRVAIEYSSFTGNSGAHVEVDGPDTTVRVTVDSSAFRGTALRAANIGSLGVSRSVFDQVTEAAVQADRVRRVSLVAVNVGNTSSQGALGAGAPFAVDVNAADSLRVDSATVHDNQGGGLICRACRAVFLARSGFVRNLLDAGYASGTPAGNIVLGSPARALLYGLTVANAAAYGVWVQVQGQASRTVIDSSSVTGAPMLVRAEQGPSPSFGLGDTLSVTRSFLQGGTGVWAGGLTNLLVSGSAMDSVDTGVRWFNPGLATVYGNSFTRVGAAAVHASAGTAVVDSNAISGCRGGYGVYLESGAAGSVTRNAINGCTYGVASTAFGAPTRLRVGRNLIEGDTVNAGASISVAGAYDSVAITGNTIQRGRSSGIQLAGSSTGIGYARVDSNLVQGIRGTGMAFTGVVTAVLMRYNTLADDDVGLSSAVPVQGTLNTVARNVNAGATFGAPAPSVFRRGNFVGNAHLALSNGYGPPPVLADSSYWGDRLGPRCLGQCDPGSAGDSVGPYVAFPPTDTVLVAGAPPIPAPWSPSAPAGGGVPAAPALPARTTVGPAARPVPSLRPQPAGGRP